MNAKLQELADFLNKYKIPYTQRGELFHVAGNVFLSYCNIKTLPELFGNIRCGGSIWLSCNQIEVIPESFGNLRCWGRVCLNSNQIKVVPESFGNLRCGWGVNLYGNPLTQSIPEVQILKDGEITRDYVYADGFFLSYYGKKKVGKYTIFYNDFACVAKYGKTFAHGKTVRQSISDLIFKRSKRNAEKYRTLPIDKKLTIEQAIVMYRQITGACSFGVERFMEGKKWGKMISIREIGKLVDGQYEEERFKEFFQLAN